MVILDTDESRQSIVNLLFVFIAIYLFLISRLRILNGYIICNEFIVNLLKNKLMEEGYYIKNITKGIYLIYPVLYGKRD
jgi:hypothetical protein